MILLYEPASAGPFMTVYKDSEDASKFYYIPAFAELRKMSDGRLAFGAALFKDFSLYNFGVNGITPSDVLDQAKKTLEASLGGQPVTIQPVPALDVSLTPITNGIYRSIKCQTQGGNIYTDLAASFTADSSLEPTLSQFFQTSVGWTGAINFTVRTKKTTFDWKIRANWHQVQEHFRSQISVRYWFVAANLSYETQKLIQSDVLHIEITGGTPTDKEKIYTFAEKIVSRLFLPTISPAPLPDHPSGAAFCFSLNYSKTEEDKTSEWSGSEADFEEKQMGIAVYVKNIPKDYFVGFDKPLAVNLDIEDTHKQFGYVTAKVLAETRREDNA